MTHPQRTCSVGVNTPTSNNGWAPDTPELLGGLPEAGADRLSLAEWMVDPKNPLTSRVIANRMWHLFFGRGIVATLEDFGSQGSPPTHPELLNHLARSLIDNRWDLHWLCREIVLSATYRQSSKVSDPEVYRRDRDNQWFTRGPKHRLSAEQLRDAVLAASDLLVQEIGGPSVMPYQPAGLWKESGTGKTYEPSKGDGLFRRSLYTFWKRTAPPPTMLTLDATSRESCTPRRELTTTPLQALVFLNDPQYVEASRVLGGNADQESPWRRTRIHAGTNCSARLISAACRATARARTSSRNGCTMIKLKYFGSDKILRKPPRNSSKWGLTGGRWIATNPS